MADDGVTVGSGPGLVVVNPTVARLRDPSRRRRLLGIVCQSVLERTGQAPRVIDADTPASMGEQLGRGLEDQPGLVVAVGGDGTIRDVAGRVASRAVPLAIVPMGTANLFAAALRIPLRPEQAARLIPIAAPRRVDLATVRFGAGSGQGDTERLFMVGAGLGFDARVMAAASSESKRRLGRYAYFTAAVRELARAEAVPIRVVADGTTLDLDAFEVLVANSGELIPGVVGPALRVNPGDGLLDVFIVAGRGRADAILGAAESLVRRGSGRSRSGRSCRLRVRSVRVTTTTGAPVEVDGDVVGSGWFEATVIPGALRVLSPPRRR